MNYMNRIEIIQINKYFCLLKYINEFANELAQAVKCKVNIRVLKIETKNDPIILMYSILTYRKSRSYAC